mmetsp:Transcript_50279/g.116062  ORF Transcript_50279/g.116062 Transcript_50279/m.116062 type:complete len:580 (-) Transcript_50279:280-2019(-)
MPPSRSIPATSFGGGSYDLVTDPSDQSSDDEPQPPQGGVQRSAGDKDKHQKRKDRKRERKEEKRERKEKKEKRSRKEKKEREKHPKRQRETSDEPAAPDTASVPPPRPIDMAAAASALEQLLTDVPGVLDDVSGLLETLDSGSAVVLAQIEDAVVRAHLERFAECASLDAEAMPDGSVAHSASASVVEGGSTSTSLCTHFAPVFERARRAGPAPPAGGTAASDGGGEGSEEGAAADRGEGGGGVEVMPEAASGEAAARKRIYGAALPTHGVGGASIGPAGPPKVEMSPHAVLEVEEDAPLAEIRAVYKRKVLTMHPDKGGDPLAFVRLQRAYNTLAKPGSADAVEARRGEAGPRLPTEEELEAAVSSEPAKWWQREVQAPTAPTAGLPGEEAEAEGEKEREEWMTSLPTDRTGFDGKQARTFMRQTHTKAQVDQEWTTTPQQKEAATRAEQQRSQSSALQLNGADRAVPMSLAEAAALASSRNAMGVRHTFATAAVPEAENESQPKPKSLVEVKAELAAQEKAKGKPKEWEKNHPWKPWDRDKDLVVRKEKSADQMLNDPVMGKLSLRFGGARRETSFI